MKKASLLISLSIIIFLTYSCSNSSREFRSIKPEVLKDKIAGGWAGKMIGVTYGAPTEFRAQSKFMKIPSNGNLLILREACGRTIFMSS